MCSPLAGNFWSTPVLVHKGLKHGVMTSLPWQTGLQSWQSCTIALACSVGYKWRSHQLQLHNALAHSVGYKWRSHQDSPSEGLISYMWIQSDSDLTGLINFQGVCVTGLMCSPLAGNFWSTPVLVHTGLIHGVMTSLPWQTGLQSWQSCTIALACSVGYKWRSYWDSPSEGLISYMWIQSDSDLTGLKVACSHHIRVTTFVANWMCKCNGAWLLALETSLPRQRSHKHHVLTLYGLKLVCLKSYWLMGYTLAW